MDRIRGLIYGCAVGDALGVPYEWMPPRDLEGVDIVYRDVTRSNGESYVKGEWSDDTDQTLALVEAWMLFWGEGGSLLTEVAQALRRSVIKGKGCGKHTRKVIDHPLFRVDPLRAAFEVTLEDGSRGNGGLMRTPVTVFFGETPQEVSTVAHMLCDVTHPDPECCRMSRLLVGVLVGVHGGKSVQECVPYPEFDLSVELEDLGLGDEPYALSTKTFAAGIKALDLFMQGSSFEEVLVRVIRCGGDADTNAAVAGALMGFTGGFDCIPIPLIEGLHDRKPLDFAVSELSYYEPHYV